MAAAEGFAIPCSAIAEAERLHALCWGFGNLRGSLMLTGSDLFAF
jgi:hypothetical protein